MPKVPVDVTIAGMVDPNDYTADVTKLDYQVKTGDKWNKDGTYTCAGYEEWSQFPMEVRRLHYTLKTGKGNLWVDFYMKDGALGFLKEFLKKTGCQFDKTGFDPEEPIGKQIGISVVVKDDPEYGQRNDIAKSWKI